MSKRVVYQGHQPKAVRVILIIGLLGFGITIFASYAWVFFDSIWRVILVWTLMYGLYYAKENWTYIKIEDGELWGRSSGLEDGAVEIEYIKSIHCGTVQAYRGGDNPALIVKTKHDPKALTIGLLNYQEKVVMKLLSDLRQLNPNIEYDTETYALMQGRFSLYHGLVDVMTGETIADDRDTK